MNERKSLCHACRMKKPSVQMIHAYGHRMYCSKGCAAKAQWMFGSVPLPKSA